MHKTLKRISQDSASVPQANSVGFLKDVLLKRTRIPGSRETAHNNIQTHITILNFIYIGDVPKDIKDLLAYNESFRFYKDPIDTNAIRPISISIAKRRTAVAHMVMISRDHVAEYLEPPICYRIQQRNRHR